MIDEILELRKLLRRQYLPPSDLKVLQENRLRALIRHAYENVPDYRSRFHSAGLFPKDIRSIKDLGYFPIATKEDLRAAGLERMTKQGGDLSTHHVSSTSGVTRKPFDVYLNHGEVRN